MEKTTAIILAGGQGKRMNSAVAKQYLLLEGKPVLYYSIQAFQNSEVDEIIIVTQQGEEQYVNDAIVTPYQFDKVKKIVAGGKERYHSVFNGLKAINCTNYVLIHDGARPFINSTVIHDSIQCVKKKKACVVGVQTKDTIKIVNNDQIVVDTPNRSDVWLVQTPQAFEYNLIRHAYEMLMQQKEITVTDDAMVMEKMLHYPIHMVQGSYDNIKITTPEDIGFAESIIRSGRIS